MFYLVIVCKFTVLYFGIKVRIIFVKCFERGFCNVCLILFSLRLSKMISIYDYMFICEKLLTCYMMWDIHFLLDMWGPGVYAVSWRLEKSFL